MRLHVLDDRLAVARLAPEGPPPPPTREGFWSLTRTAEELSVVAAEEALVGLSEARIEVGWRALMVAGPLDFSLVGVLASLASSLAAAGVSLFALSTFDTDYLLVKAGDLGRAFSALAAAGHEVVGAPERPVPASSAFSAIELSDEIPPSLCAALGAGLERHAEAAGVSPRRVRPLAVVARDDGGAVIGGLTGSTVWGWLRISLLWVAEEHRDSGLGGELLARAESAAMERGCHGAWVDTESFQAPDFYRRRGYDEMAVLEDHPRGHQRLFLRKRLSAG